MEQKNLHFIVGNEEKGVRLDVFLASRIEGETRSRIKQLIIDGLVVVEGRPAQPAAKTLVGQAIDVQIPPPAPVDVEPQELPLEIIYEDADIVVVNKAAGMVVHPAAGNPDGTLVNALLHHCRDLSGIGGEIRPGIVHRLDKGTSGVLVVAKNDHAHQALSDQFKGRSVSKQYVAVVLGRPETDRGVWDKPIGRHPVDRKKMSTRSRHSRSARTLFEVLASRDGVSVLALKIETGRTHQIRVHCADAGCPVAHDETYSCLRRIDDIRDPQLREMIHDLSRPALHAFELRLEHPIAKRTMSFRAPLPKDIASLVKAVSNGELPAKLTATDSTVCEKESGAN